MPGTARMHCLIKTQYVGGCLGGTGVRGGTGGQGTFHPPCHIQHYHMVLALKGLRTKMGFLQKLTVDSCSQFCEHTKTLARKKRKKQEPDLQTCRKSAARQKCVLEKKRSQIQKTCSKGDCPPCSPLSPRAPWSPGSPPLASLPPWSVAHAHVRFRTRYASEQYQCLHVSDNH